MLYFFVTTSYSTKNDQRKNQYIKGINSLKNIIKNLKIDNYKIIIIENNGKRNTFLETLDETVFYTDNNFLKTKNKGIKELKDIKDCINHFDIKDNDFIVKLTGRYLIDEKSVFMNVIKNIHNTNYKCVVKFGSYIKPVNHKTNDCITGLIGMTSFYIKQIENPNSNQPVEWKWGKIASSIENENIFILDELGIYISPGNCKPFKV